MIKSTLLTKEQKQKYCDDFIRFFQEERDENIGIIGAQMFLDFFLEKVGNKIYNNALDNSKLFFAKKLEDLEYELDELKLIEN